MLSINGLPCHEIGCPNSHSRYDADSETWVKQVECSICGCKVDAGDICCNDHEEYHADADDDAADEPYSGAGSLMRAQLPLDLN